MLFNSGIGIDIDSRQVAIVHVKGSFKGVRLVAESSRRLDPDQPVSERMREAAGFVNEFIKTQKIASAGVFIGIPGQYFMLREIEFPLAVKENLRGALEYEMEKYIPLSVEDIYFDFQVISEDPAQQRLKVLLAAIRKEQAEPYIELAGLLDHGGSGIELTAAAVSNYFLRQFGSGDDPGMIVHMRQTGFELIFIHHQALVYSRTVAFGDPEPEPDSLVISHLTQVKTMFHKTDERVKLYFYGKNIDDRLSRKLTEELQFDLLEPETVNAELPGVTSVAAAGLALRGVYKLPIRINIMPVHLRKKPDKTGLMVMMALAMILAVSVVFWAGSHVMSQRQLMAKMDQELESLKSEAAKIEAMQTETKNLQDRMNYLDSLRPGNVYVADVLKDLTERIPVTAWVREMRLSGTELSLYGIADSASELITLLDASPIFTDVKFLSTIRKGKDDKEIFRIGLQIHGP